MPVKNNLEQIRLKMGYRTQKQFAEEVLSMRQDDYSRYINNKVKPSLKQALHISGRLGISVNEIFYLDTSE